MLSRTWFLLSVFLVELVSSCRIIAFAGEEAVNGRRLLLETENNLPELAYDKSFLPGVHHSKHWNPEQCSLRNTAENRDGWGVGWYAPDGAFPLRYRTAESIIDETNTTSPVFKSLLDGYYSKRFPLSVC